MAKDNIFFTSTTEIGKQHTPIDSESKMSTGGNVLLAPNGKPSHLTAEQYKLVRTPEFKAWFGDWENNPENASKVVDENGEPMPVYHGTTYEFTTFEESSYFTDDYMNADGYAHGEIVLEAFLILKNPLIINAKGRKWDDLKSKYGSSTREIVGALDQEKYDGVIFNNINDNWFDDEGDTQNVYNVNKPNQIKLADGTNTTFDGNNPDIRFKNGGNMENETPKVKLAVKNKIKQLAKRIVEISNLNLGDEDDFFSYKGKLSFKERRKLFEENRKLEAQLNEVTNTLSQEQCFSIDDSNFQGLNTGGDYGYQDEEMYAGGGGIDINEPFDVNGKTLAERVRVLLKQLYPTYKWSVTSSYSKMDVYLLEADFEPFTDFFKQKNPDRNRYSVDDRDFEEYMKNNAYITERAVEVFKPIREYINKFVYNRNANDPYADVDYNIYEYTYIGKWDKPYVQVAPKTKKGKTAVQPAVQIAATPTKVAIQEEIKIGTIIAFGAAYLKTQDWGLAEQMSEEYAFVESIENSGGETKLKITFVNVPKSPNISFNYSSEQIFEDYVKATVPLFETGDMVALKTRPTEVLKITHRIFYQNGLKYSENKDRFELDGFAWQYQLADGTYFFENEIQIVAPATQTPPTTPTVSETAFLDYLKATNEKAELIPQKVEVLTSLALFIKTAEEIDNIDTKKYAELLTELMEVSPKNPN